MKLKILFATLSILIIAFTVWQTPAFTNSGGPPNAVAGAPGNGTCANCHSGAGLNAGPEQLSITFSGANNQYVPGQTYQVTVSFVSSRPRHGFQLVARSGAGNNVNAGTLAVTSASTTQAAPSGSDIYIEHTSGGTFQTSWTCNWTAPSVAVGNVTFFAAGNAANNNGSTGGDNIYTTSRVITASTVQGLPVASIQKQTMEIYPNPASEFVRIKSGDLGGQSADFLINDLQGRAVYSQTMQASDWNSGELEIRLPKDLAEGLYVAQLVGAKGRATQVIKIAE
jgi:hypothetical protein